MRRLLYWGANLWLLVGAAGVGLLPVLAPTLVAFLFGGSFLVGTMSIAWILIEAIWRPAAVRVPGVWGALGARLRIRFAFLLAAPVVVLYLLVRGEWFAAVWPGLLAMGALLRSLELLVGTTERSRPRAAKPPFLGQ